MGLSNSGPTHGEITMTGSAVQIPAVKTGKLRLHTVASNDPVYIGGSGVTTANGFPLREDVENVFDTVSSGKYYLIGTNTQTVRYFID